MSDLISIIIPIYNSEKYLQKCLQSVRRQSYQNIEIILVDDGSTDQSARICDKYAKKDSRFQVYHIKNQGVSHARNYGILQSSGKYICFIDSDDWVPEHYVKSLASIIVRNEIDLVLCPLAGQIEEEWTDFIFDFNQYDSEKFLFLSENYFLYGPVCKIYNVSVLRENRIFFPEEMSYGEDLVFNMKYLRYCNKLYVTNQTSYYYIRENSNSLSQKYREDAFEIEKKLYQELLDFMKIKKIKDQKLEQYYYRRYFDTAYNVILKNGEHSFFKKYRSVTNILKDQTLKEAYQYGNIADYSSKIICLMKHKCSLLLTIIARKKGK